MSCSWPSTSTENAAPSQPAKRRVRLGHDLLDILGVELPAADDDRVLEPAGDEQLTVQEEAEISRSQIAAGFLAGDPGAEDLLRLVGAAPVARGDARPGNPDLAHAVIGACPARGRVNDPTHRDRGSAARSRRLPWRRDRPERQ